MTITLTKSAILRRWLLAAERPEVERFTAELSAIVSYIEHEPLIPRVLCRVQSWRGAVSLA